MKDIAVMLSLSAAGLVAALGLYGVASPGGLLALVRRAWEAGAGLALAVVFRIAFGVALVVAASASNHPRALAVLGWLSVASGILAAVLGRRRAVRLVDWWSARSSGFTRAWAALAALFGGLLAAALLGVV
jgi:hypothetical protein